MVEHVINNRYMIGQQLGKNAGRRTVLAQDLQTQQLVVVKILTFDPGCQWDDIKLFEREAETLQSLSHPSIPSYLNHFEFQTRKTKGFALVQSYIEARSLEKWVNLGRTFNEIELKQVAESLLEILIYLHSQSPPVIHRDIKPSNILLTNRSGNSIGQVYLVDFGSVQTLVRTAGSTMTVVGTYGYMPPEQFGGRALPATDLYSLGATLIYLATGKHPADLPQEDLRIQFKPKHYLSPGFRDWLNWLIEPSLNHRIDSAEKAVKELGKINYHNHSSPKIIKPEKSKIELKKTDDSLEIIIPSSPLTKFSWILFLGSIYMGLRWFFTKPSTQNIIENFNQPFLLEIYNFIGANLFLIGIGIFLVFLVLIPISTLLKIDSKKIYLTGKSLLLIPCGIRSSSSKKHICQIGLLQNSNNNSSHHNIENIQIWAGTQEYCLPTMHLKRQEIDWLVSELSSYLNLPIAHTIQVMDHEN